MEITKLSFIVFAFCLLRVLYINALEPINAESENELLGKAINEIIESRFATTTGRVDILVSADENKHLFDEIIEDISKKSRGSVSFSIFKVESFIEGNEIPDPIIILAESIEQFLNTWNKTAENGKSAPKKPFLVYIKNCTNNVLEIFQDFSAYKLQFLIMKEDRIKLLEFKFLTPGKCFDPHLTEVSIFYDYKWSKIEFFPERYENLNQCEIFFEVEYKSPEIIIKNNNGIAEFSGYSVDILIVLAQKMNFKFSFYIDPEEPNYESDHHHAFCFTPMSYYALVPDEDFLIVQEPYF